jgi:hypothetical protein
LRITCGNNLKQIDLVLHLWAGNHGDQYPWNISTNAGGTKEFCAPDKDGFDANSFRHFQVMSNELKSPLVLICPHDPSKKPAANFASLTPSNVSYRIRVVPGVTPDTAGSNHTPIVVCPVDGNALNYDDSLKIIKPEPDF